MPPAWEMHLSPTPSARPGMCLHGTLPPPRTGGRGTDMQGMVPVVYVTDMRLDILKITHYMRIIKVYVTFLCCFVFFIPLHLLFE